MTETAGLALGQRPVADDETRPRVVALLFMSCSCWVWAPPLIIGFPARANFTSPYADSVWCRGLLWSALEPDSCPGNRKPCAR